MKITTAVFIAILSLQWTCCLAWYTFSTHIRDKRSCNFKGEPCTKDYECCTTNCICLGSDPCFCGKRPKPKIIRGANFLDIPKRDRDKYLAHDLVCRYITDKTYY